MRGERGKTIISSLFLLLKKPAGFVQTVGFLKIEVVKVLEFPITPVYAPGSKTRPLQHLESLLVFRYHCGPWW